MTRLGEKKAHPLKKAVCTQIIVSNGEKVALLGHGPSYAASNGMFVDTARSMTVILLQLTKFTKTETPQWQGHWNDCMTISCYIARANQITARALTCFLEFDSLSLLLVEPLNLSYTTGKPIYLKWRARNIAWKGKFDHKPNFFLQCVRKLLTSPGAGLANDLLVWQSSVSCLIET